MPGTVCAASPGRLKMWREKCGWRWSGGIHTAPFRKCAAAPLIRSTSMGNWGASRQHRGRNGCWRKRDADHVLLRRGKVLSQLCRVRRRSCRAGTLCDCGGEGKTQHSRANHNDLHGCLCQASVFMTERSLAIKISLLQFNQGLLFCGSMWPGRIG